MAEVGSIPCKVCSTLFVPPALGSRGGRPTVRCEACRARSQPKQKPLVTGVEVAAGSVGHGSAADGPEVELSERGSRLWQQLMGVRNMASHEVALIDEICRVRDRLDRLDRLQLGDGNEWARVEWDVRSREVTLVIDDALAEARQQAGLFKTLLQALKLPESAVATGGKSLVEQLADARAARRAAARGAEAADRVAPAVS